MGCRVWGVGCGEVGKWGSGEVGKWGVGCGVWGVGKETSFICGGENFFIGTDS